MQTTESRGRLLELLHGYRGTCVIVAGVEVGVAEALRTTPDEGHR